MITMIFKAVIILLETFEYSVKLKSNICSMEVVFIIKKYL